MTDTRSPGWSGATPTGRTSCAWSPSAGTIDAAGLEGHDAVVHLAGVGIGDHRWTADHKAAVLDSRVKGTSLLAGTLAGLDRQPKVLASASAVGYYGDRGAQPVTEADGPGTGFLADVVRQWEDATAPAATAGIRVARLRSGVVLTDKGGALDKQLLAFKMGVGGRIGSGEQYLSWISLDDEVAAIRHVLDTDTIEGPVNLTAPAPVTNAEFTKALGTVLGRPTVLPGAQVRPEHHVRQGDGGRDAPRRPAGAAGRPPGVGVRLPGHRDRGRPPPHPRQVTALAAAAYRRQGPVSAPDRGSSRTAESSLLVSA